MRCSWRGEHASRFEVLGNEDSQSSMEVSRRQSALDASGPSALAACHQWTRRKNKIVMQVCFSSRDLI